MCFGFCRLESWLDEADDQADAVRPARTLVTKTHPNPKPHRQEKFVSKRWKVPAEKSRQQAVGTQPEVLLGVRRRQVRCDPAAGARDAASGPRLGAEMAPQRRGLAHVIRTNVSENRAALLRRPRKGSCGQAAALRARLQRVRVPAGGAAGHDSRRHAWLL